MSNEMQGAVFGGPLERLRQAARIDLPRIADEYAKIRSECETTSHTDVKLDRPAYFGSPALKDGWTTLRDVVWSATGETSENLWDLAQGLESALEKFIGQDQTAADEMYAARGRLQSDTSRTNDEWTAGYSDGHYPS
jgi:hypothetical protein